MVIWLSLDRWNVEVFPSLLLVVVKIWHRLPQIILLVFNVMLSQDFQPVQMHIFPLWDFV